MRYSNLFILAVIGSLSISMGFASEKKAYIKDTRIHAETEEGTTSIDHSGYSRPRVYQIKNWVIREQIDPVNEALKVFKKRKTPLYSHKVWIYDKIVDQNDVYVDFITNDQNKDIVFSPDEEFVYYLEQTPDGESHVYGVKLGTEEKFFINVADDFFIETCSDTDTSYVVTSKDGEIQNYHIFDLEGQKVQLIDKLDDIEDFKSVICY